MESPEKSGARNLNEEPTRRIENTSLEAHALAVTIERIQKEMRKLESSSMDLPIDPLTVQNSKDYEDRYNKLADQEQSLLAELKKLKPDYIGIAALEEEVATRSRRLKATALTLKLLDEGAELKKMRDAEKSGKKINPAKMARAKGKIAWTTKALEENEVKAQDDSSANNGMTYN